MREDSRLNVISIRERFSFMTIIRRTYSVYPYNTSHKAYLNNFNTEKCEKAKEKFVFYSVLVGLHPSELNPRENLIELIYPHRRSLYSSFASFSFSSHSRNNI